MFAERMSGSEHAHLRGEASSLWAPERSDGRVALGLGDHTYAGQNRPYSSQAQLVPVQRGVSRVGPCLPLHPPVDFSANPVGGGEIPRK